MSSPSRYEQRLVLSPRPHNTPTSLPTKGSKSSRSSRVSSPGKYRPKITPRPSLGFTIFEDPELVRRGRMEIGNNDILAPVDKENKVTLDDYVTMGHENGNRWNHNDQENILQPQQQPRHSSKHGLSNRLPLQALSISEYPGFYTHATSASRLELTTVWQPPNADDGHRSLHKHNNIPSFITPPRNLYLNRLEPAMGAKTAEALVESKFLYSSLNYGASMELEACELDADDVEMHLKQKSRRKRAFSVGQNETKRKLICKNNFEIST